MTPSACVRARDHSLRLDVELLLRACFVFALDDEVRRCPRGVDIAFFDEKGFEDIVLAPDDFFFRERILDGEDSGQRLDFDAHRAARFFEQIFIGMREQDDGFFGMIYNAVGEAGLIFDDQRDAILVGDIFGGDDGEFIPRDAVAEMDAADSAARGWCCERWRRAACPGK